MIARTLSILFLFLFLTSCASLKKAICNCPQPCRDSHGSEERAHSAEKANEKTAEKSAEKSADKPSEKSSPISVSYSDLEVGQNMAQAVDDFVFKNQKMEFVRLCLDPRFDCYLNEKRFPKNRKKIKRKVPPFLSGSKMGLQGEKRIHVKYDFYP